MHTTTQYIGIRCKVRKIDGSAFISFYRKANATHITWKHFPLNSEKMKKKPHRYYNIVTLNKSTWLLLFQLYYLNSWAPIDKMLREWVK